MAKVFKVFTFSEAEFQELLNDESMVNIHRLREAARYGVPQSVRGEVWKFLLGVSKPDKSEEMSIRKRMVADFAKLQSKPSVPSAIIAKIRTDVHNFASRKADIDTNFFNSQDTRRNFENLLLVFLSTHSAVVYTPGLVNLVSPFLYCIGSVVDVYYCISRHHMMLTHSPVARIGKTLSTFMMLFRTFQSELCMYLEDQEVTPNMWAVAWIQQMLAGALPHECLFRLWDTYFASEEGWDLHIYVCLAILRNCAEDLMELEYSELLLYLNSLPSIDMNQIIMHAYSIRGEVFAQKLIKI
mmetsp:Transcript_22431/g.44486  ORF Transcript_22431/g.44486 Transcript_22431/m.44486 type:complete len:298 (-) Transcript_22431:135-1028(-)